MIRRSECPYWKECMDYKRFKDTCHNKEWTYCQTYQRLNKKEEEFNERNKRTK